MKKNKTINGGNGDHDPVSNLMENLKKVLYGSMTDLARIIRPGTEGRVDVRALVDLYYQMQECRKRAGNQAGAADRSGESAESVAAFNQVFGVLEETIKRMLDAWTDGDPTSAWAKSFVGVGPVIAAALAAHIDPFRANTPSAIWRFAGLDPTQKWIGREGADAICKEMKTKFKKADQAVEMAAAKANVKVETIRKFAEIYGEGKITWDSLKKSLARKPWNARLKVVCWKLGDSFCKVHNNPRSFYGKIYAEAKLREVALDESGEHAEIAKAALEEKNYGSRTVARASYEAGQLPPARLEQRARRKAIKMFLSHYWAVMYRNHRNEEPPKPWIIAHGGHVDLVTAEDARRYEDRELEEEGEAA